MVEVEVAEVVVVVVAVVVVEVAEVVVVVVVGVVVVVNGGVRPTPAPTRSAHCASAPGSAR